MKSFLVANPKGGSGKTTLATNLAGFYARCGHRVMLGDTDRQLSARTWLQARPPRVAPDSHLEHRKGLAGPTPARDFARSSRFPGWFAWESARTCSESRFARNRASAAVVL